MSWATSWAKFEVDMGSNPAQGECLVYVRPENVVSIQFEKWYGDTPGGCIRIGLSGTSDSVRVKGTAEEVMATLDAAIQKPRFTPDDSDGDPAF